MAEERFLVVRLSSLGDIVHALPAVHALREAFPQARIDWIVERNWLPLLEGNPDVNERIVLDHSSWGAMRACVQEIRAARYTCVIDFQGLYKSAVLAWLSGASRCIGFHRTFAREGGAAMFYTERVRPAGVHVVEQNIALVERVGARLSEHRFPLHIPAEADAYVERELGAHDVREFYVLNPGGGWRSKCWPPERYAELHAEIARRHGWRGVVNFGPKERDLAEAVRKAAGEPEPVLLPLDLPQLLAVLRRAKCFVGGDSGPLHLAVALGTPVVGLYGPTDPARNGPFNPADTVIRNAQAIETTYKRSDEYSPAMLSITVDQVVAAVARRLGMR